jgi:hypothetical protein
MLYKHITNIDFDYRVDKDADGRITEEEIKDVWYF